jgi:thymidylate synthase|tara:strand:+ start:289 stop:1044 length:756 start_codon:yes stop_codon:yes gene_type:complete
MNKFEIDYTNLLKDVLKNGVESKNRTGINTAKLFNKSLNIDLNNGFPVVTGKKIFFNKALAEFQWMFGGNTDLKYLQDRGVNWWNDFAHKGSLGKVYGYQIRNYNNSFDQVQYVINEIKSNSRRALINLWNPTDLKDQALPCCFTQMNFVRTNDTLNLAVNFRSSDLFLGLPYDIIVGGLFLVTIAKLCDLNPAVLGINLMDAHIYKNHYNQTAEYIKSDKYILPTLEGGYNNYHLKNYKSNKLIKAPLAI